MSNKTAVRPLRLPQSDFASLKVPRTRLPSRTWYRVHPGHYDGIHFTLNPGHRFSHAQCPCPFLYFGADPDTCLFERFGGLLYDQKKALASSLWQACSLSAIRVPQLAVCDLTSAKTLGTLMVDLSSLMHNELATPQAWGLAIQQHPAAFQAVRFESRFNGKPCLALIQRNGIDKQLTKLSNTPLSNNDDAVNWLHKHEVHLY